MAEYYIAPKSSFDATADAIREKAKSQATIEWTQDGFADAIDAIPRGEVWTRPSEWRPMANGCHDSTFEGVYFVYDTTNNIYADAQDFWAVRASTSSGRYNVDLGHVSTSGEFIIESSATYASGSTADGFLPLWDGESDPYFVVRVTPISPNMLRGVYLWGPTNATISTKYPSASVNGNVAYTMTCIEVYGRLPNVNNMASAFRTSKLIHVDVRDMVSLTSISYIFNGNRNMQQVDGLETWDTKNVTVFDSAFYNCNILTDISGLLHWDVGKATNMNAMFAFCGFKGELDLSNWVVSSSLTTISYMFRSMYRCDLIKTFSGDVSGITSATDVFRECYATNIVFNWGTLSAANYSYFFNDAYRLDFNKLDMSKIDISNATNLNGFFTSSQQITSIDFHGMDTSHVTTMSNFAGGSAVQYIDFTGCNFSNITDTATNQFGTCYRLLRLKGFVYPKSFKLDNSTMMPASALVEVLENLPTVSGQTITLGTTNKNKLTSEQIAIATEKGWTVA